MKTEKSSIPTVLKTIGTVLYTMYFLASYFLKLLYVCEFNGKTFYGPLSIYEYLYLYSSNPVGIKPNMLFLCLGVLACVLGIITIWYEKKKLVIIPAIMNLVIMMTYQFIGAFRSVSIWKPYRSSAKIWPIGSRKTYGETVLLVLLLLLLLVSIVMFFCKAAQNPKKKSNITKLVDSPSELLKYKELLDADAITQEEYDAKKKELLNL